MITSSFLFSQEVKKDSVKVHVLDEVVVTGQLKPQSIKKSVFEVKVITSKDIENRAGNNLADLLSQTLNIDVFQNASTGKSEINVLGLDGKYFKVLIDNIPVVNEEGFGNNTDLTLINLDDVERIELVQGAMGVQYGANALSGVLNIITKKKSKYKWKVNAFLQEETVGNEYELFNQGRHIQSVNVGYKLTEEDYVNVSFNRNDFRGFLGDYKGKYHDENDNLRGHDWLPKNQNFAKLLFSHKKENFSFFYKFDYLNENIFSYDSIVRTNFITSTQTSNPSSLDERFSNERFVHHANITGSLGDVLYNISTSYQKQEKKRESFTYFIRKDEKENIADALYLSKKVWYSRGSFSNLINTDKFNLQGGYEFTNESGYSSSEGTTIADGDESVSNTLRNFDLFASSEIIFSESFAVKPGIRASFTNLFGTQFYYGVSARKLLKNDWEARAILGYSTRIPNFDELYTFLVNTNHDIQGNENLNPEKGLSTFFHLKKRTNITDDLIVNNKLTLSYIKTDERIELIVINEDPLQSQYNNIDEFSSLGASLENSFYYKNLKLNIGVSYFGVQKMLDYDSGELSPYQGNFQLNTNFTYTIPKIETSLTAYYKYIGETNRFLIVDGSYQNQIINPYSWLDITVHKKFLDKKIGVTLGVRNLLNVVDINTNSVSNGAHTGSDDSISLGYGRSFFLKLGYNFKI
jgi:outer membrane receptor for ferrienterochelin and colicins